MPGKTRLRECRHSQRKSSARRISRPPNEVNREAAEALLDFYVISGESLTQSKSQEHRRGVWRRPHDDSFSNDFTRRVIPLIFCRHASVAIYSGPAIGIKREPLGLVGNLMFCAGITEDAEIIADFHALRRAQINVEDVV